MLTFKYKISTLDYIVKTTDTELLKNKINSVIDTICERYEKSKDSHSEQEIKFTSDRED